MGEFASRGVGTAGLTTGIIGTAGWLLNGGLGGLFGGGNNCAAVACSENMAVNRYELDLVQEISKKDTRIGLLESQVYTDNKLVDVVKDYTAQINALAAEVRSNKEEQAKVNMDQATYNGVNTATLNCMQGQIAQLMSLTKLVVPNASVCPGWGNVTITAGGTTTPAA